jgi:hypothetical protein
MTSSALHIAGALLLSTSLLACGSDASTTTHPTDGSAAVALAAAVRVEAIGCSATASIGGGSFIAEGIVVTVAHVIAGADHVHVVLADGSRPRATVVAIDRSTDLALLAVPASVLPLQRGTMAAGDVGSFVAISEDRAVVHDFEALSVLDIDAPTIDDGGSSVRRGFHIEADVAKGDSGAVLVSDGKAVAVVFARSTATDGTAWATDLSEIEPLLSTATDAAVDVGVCL